MHNKITVAEFTKQAKQKRTQRLRNIVSKEKLLARDIAEILGIKKQTVWSYLAENMEDRVIPVEQLEYLEYYFDI